MVKRWSLAATILLTCINVLPAQIFSLGTPCFYTVSIDGNFPSGSSTSIGSVTTTDPSCDWAVESGSTPWVLVDPSSGRGSGNFLLTVSPYDASGGLPRTGSITIEKINVVRFTQTNAQPTPKEYLFPADVPDDRDSTFSILNHIILMKAKQISDGCGEDQYCPNQALTKGEVSALVLRAAKFPDGDTLRYTDIERFADVPRSHRFYPWITRLFELGLAKPCGISPNPTPLFCPDSLISRGEFSELLIKARFLEKRWLFSNEQFFPADVPVGHPQFPYIQMMRQMGITSGTGAATFSPDDPLTRVQAAVFLIRAFFTPESGLYERAAP